MNSRVIAYFVIVLAIVMMLIWSIYFHKNSSFTRVDMDLNSTEKLAAVQESITMSRNDTNIGDGMVSKKDESILNQKIKQEKRLVGRAYDINASTEQSQLKPIKILKESSGKAESNNSKKEPKMPQQLPKKEIYDFTKSLLNSNDNISYKPEETKRSVPISQILMSRPRYKRPTLNEMMKRVGVKTGNRVYIRIFKKEKVLELWMRRDKAYHLVYTYPICAYSGKLGPKQREGDKQSPEGFYSVPYSKLNPNSHYHLSFNLGYPNAYDRSHGRTGSYLMVHGKCASVGCYAMTDRKIEEIYSLVESALQKGQQSIAVHAFPFRMTQYNINKYKKSMWYPFWQNLKEGYDIFQKSHVPPEVDVENGRYVFYE